MSRGCPHKHKQFCPLYVALHDPEAVRFGCDDGEIWNGCAVDRGKLDYQERLARLSAAHPRLVAIVEFNDQAERDRQQRRRNQTMNGVH